MLIWRSYNKADIGQDWSMFSYDLHDNFSVGSRFWTCIKTSQSPHTLWRFVKTYQDFPRVTKTCRTTSLYIVHDWPRLTGRRCSYRGRIWLQIRCDPGLSEIKSNQSYVGSITDACELCQSEMSALTVSVNGGDFAWVWVVICIVEI